MKLQYLQLQIQSKPFSYKIGKSKDLIYAKLHLSSHLLFSKTNINHINHTSESYYEQMFASTNIKKYSNVFDLFYFLDFGIGKIQFGLDVITPKKEKRKKTKREKKNRKETG